MELPPQGVARGLTPGFLPLHLELGTNPKGEGEKSSMGWETRREVSKKGSKAAPCPLPEGSVCLCWGVGEISDLAAPLEGEQFGESESPMS